MSVIFPNTPGGKIPKELELVSNAAKSAFPVFSRDKDVAMEPFALLFRRDERGRRRSPWI